MYEIPISIKSSNGKEYKIRNRGDYRTILDCFQALDDAELESTERLMASLLIFYEDFNSIDDLYKIENLEELVTKMYDFFNCNQQAGGNESKYKLIDWENDSQLVCSAVNKVAGYEVRGVDYLHWWTFMGYYAAIGESPIATIVSIREKIMRGKKLENYEKEFKRNNPRYFMWNNKTVADIEAENYVKQLWNSGG